MTKYRLFYFLFFIRIFPSYLSLPIKSINFSFLLLPYCLLSPKFKKILKTLSINKYKILIPLLILGLLQVTMFGIITLKTIILISSSFLGSIFIATVFTSVSIKKQIDTILSISFLISIIYLPISTMQEGSIITGRALTTLHGVSGFGAISAPLYIYVFYLLTTYKINLSYKISRFIVNSFLILSSANSSDTILSLIFFLILGITYLTRFISLDVLAKYLLKSKLVIFSLIFITLFVSSIGVGLYFLNLPEETFLEINPLTNNRGVIALAAMERFSEMSPNELSFGHGFSIGQYHFNENSPIIRTIDYGGGKQIHNSLLTILYDSGIVGFILYFTSLYNLISPLYKKMNIYYLKINKFKKHESLYMFNATKLASIILIMSLAGMDKHTDLLVYTCIVMIPLSYLRFNKSVNF